MVTSEDLYSSAAQPHQWEDILGLRDYFRSKGKLVQENDGLRATLLDTRLERNYYRIASEANKKSVMLCNEEYAELQATSVGMLREIEELKSSLESTKAGKSILIDANERLVAKCNISDSLLAAEKRRAASYKGKYNRIRGAKWQSIK